MPVGISIEELRTRVSRVRESLSERGLNALLAFSGYQEKEGHVCYLTGHHGAFPPSSNTEEIVGLGYTAVLLGVDFGPILFTLNPPAEGEDLFIESAVPGYNLLSGILSKIRERGLERSRIGIAGMDVVPQLVYSAISSSLPGARLEPLDDVLIRMRMVKSEAELRLMRRGAEIADEGFRAAADVAREGIREREVAAVVIKKCLEAGADWVARTRVYSGAARGQRWPLATDKKLKNGELFGMDLVGWYGNYAFDVMRFWVIGSPSEEQRELLERAVELTERGVSAVREGSTGDDVSRAVMELARERGVEEHARPWGHSIGIEVVELPYMLPKSHEPLRSGMTLCIEPILTSPIGRVSFEDEVIVRGGQPEVISRFPKILW